MTYSEARTAFERLFRGEMDETEARNLLIEMAERGESADEIAAAAEVMRANSVKLPVPEDLREELIDNCGTGGDRSGSFNISTTVSLLLAGAGCKVAKHGNRSITSRSGSADMLEALGIRLDLSPVQQVKMLQECGFAFIFAVLHHPAMKFIMPIRKSIPHRTIFNILGPLSNPAGVEKQLIGVFEPSYVPKLAEALKKLGSRRAMVVSSLDGLDEISVSDRSEAAVLERGEIKRVSIDPADFGIERYSPDEIRGGDAAENAKITRSILSGETRGAKRDIVLINAAAALIVDNRARDFEEGLEIAEETIDSGRAMAALEKIVQVSNAL
ncbi:anthranilate phosphoribosyltransferase [Hydrogenimonas sp.]|nr:anthranilate phosphoribosyltransferase [Hydrogenimonas sp.]